MTNQVKWRYALCNEMFEEQPLAQVAEIAAEVGYQGIEIAPFTLAELVTDITPAQRTQYRRDVERAGLDVAGLHWLLAKTDFRLNVPDRAARQAAEQYLIDLIDFCGDMGGDILVFGSPAQRDPQDGYLTDEAWKWMTEAMHRCGEHAVTRDCILCIESLGTDFITWVDDSARLVEAADSEGFKMMVDVKSMAQDDRWPVAEQIKTVAEHIRHVHVNDPNRLGPGMGDVDFAPIMAALKAIDFDRWLSVEVFEFDLGGKRIAQESLANLKAALA